MAPTRLDVEMHAVGGVAVRPRQHAGDRAAAIMRPAQKSARGPCIVPALADLDTPAIGQPKPGDIDGLRAGMPAGRRIVAVMGIAAGKTQPAFATASSSPRTLSVSTRSAAARFSRM